LKPFILTFENQQSMNALGKQENTIVALTLQEIHGNYVKDTRSRKKHKFNHFHKETCGSKKKINDKY
jgi:hypothetical protein